jgi:15-cis-phytoene synthase
MESASARQTRASNTSFYYAFLILPEAKRRAIFALYAFCRAFDDCVDDEAGGGASGLDRLLVEVERAYAGNPQTALGRDLHAAVAAFPIPRQCLLDVADGCRMDLTKTRYSTFAELEGYCARVASAVGLATIEIFGYRSPRTKDYARELGLALQLTNILRDVASDAERDRIYVPLEDLGRFGVTEKAFLEACAASSATPTLRELLGFQADRARQHHLRAASLLPAEDRGSMASARIMGGVYRALLEEIVSRGFPLRPRASLSRPRKAWIALRTLAAAAVGA